jgi:uncharacterized Ntn-hydrolase superfamily protein
MRYILSFALLLFIAMNATGADNGTAANPLHPVHTFSIICYDSATGEFGAAVQSHYFKVADVIWLEPGIGAVATQSLVDFAYGPLGLDMMKNGKSAREALAGLLASDSNNAVRQVAMIDKNGVIATHTGSKCIAEAGHIIGKNYSVQANLMLKNTVWGAMAKAFESTSGDLADKMMAALDAAQAEGGDIRVDDSPEPLVELKRLLNISRAYKHMDNGDNFIADKKYDEANAEYAKAAELDPGNVEIQFWHAQSLVMAGQLELALPIFKEVFKKDENWRILVPRLVKSDLLPNDEKIIKEIVSQ